MSDEIKRVVVVGPCASGKSTLVAGLRRRGLDAYVCSQEHSEIPTLWNHLAPDFVVVLDIDLTTLRRRRHSANWPEAIYRSQQGRLADARANADLILDSNTTGIEESVDRVMKAIGQRKAR